MPPKSAYTAWLPRRTSRNTARKSMSNSNASTPINSPPPSSSNATAMATSVVPSSSTVILASPEPSPKTLPVNSSDTENTSQTSSHATTPLSQTQPENSEKALVANSGMVKSDIDRITVNNNAATETSVEPENTTFEHFGPEKNFHIEGETVVGSGNGATNEANLSSMLVKRPHVTEESSIHPGAGPESGASGVAVSGNGKRKIVKKTVVRVVKKVIKKRVPKRLLMNGSENQGPVEKVENGMNLSEVIESSNLANNVIERSNLVDEETSLVNEVKEVPKMLDGVTENSNLLNDVIEKSNLVDGATDKTSLVNEVMEKSYIPKNNLVDMVTEKTSLVNEVMKNSNIADEITETSQVCIGARVLEPIASEKGNCISKHVCNGARVLESIASEKGNDINNLDSAEMEASNINSGARVSEPVIGEEGIDLSCIKEMETSKISIGTRVPKPMVGEKGNGQSAIRSTDTDNTKCNDVMDGANIKDVNMCVPNSMEVEKVHYAAESTTENQRTVEVGDSLMESALKESVLVDPNMHIVKKEEVGLVADKNVVLVGEKNGNSVGKPESDSGEVESDNVGLNEGLILSGEMEALERKKRRKTEIFVGGLDKDTKEEDIKKVFEEAGTIVDVRLVMNSKTGKNKGFAFVRFPTAADAKNALAKFPKIEICGKQCGVAPVEGNDTIFLGNIDRKWKTVDVAQLLEKAGIEKIDKVTLKADPNDIEKNRGFAFVELETSKDAQIAFSKLQKKNVFGKNLKIRVAWAQPLVEPAEEEILKVKSVYAEYLPSSWDEEKLKAYFKRFGEIENVVLAKDLPSSRRKDFAFINYTTRDAALACIEAVSRERLEDDGSKVKMTVSLARPISKSKQMKHASDLTSKRFLKEPKSSQATIMLHEPRKQEKHASSSYDRVAKVDTRSTTNELVQILRQQASSSHISPRQSIGTILPDHHFPLPGSKRPFSLVAHDPLYLEPRGLPRGRIESSHPISGPSTSSHGFSTQSFPYHHQGPGFTSESVNRRNIYPSHFQTREQAPYYGNNSKYHRY